MTSQVWPLMPCRSCFQIPFLPLTKVDLPYTNNLIFTRREEWFQNGLAGDSRDSLNTGFCPKCLTLNRSYCHLHQSPSPGIAQPAPTFYSPCKLIFSTLLLPLLSLSLFLFVSINLSPGMYLHWKKASWKKDKSMCLFCSLFWARKSLKQECVSLWPHSSFLLTGAISPGFIIS